MICIEVKSASEPGSVHTVVLDATHDQEGPVWIWDCGCLGFRHRQTCRHVEAAQDALDSGICRIYKTDDTLTGAQRWKALQEDG